MSKKTRREMRRQQNASKQNKFTSTTDSGTYELIDGGETIVKTNGSAQTHNAVKKQFRYAELLPHELEPLIPLIIDFYKDIKWEKAVKNPKPLIDDMFKTMNESPYSKVYVCVDENMVLQGYIWFRIDRDIWGDAYTVVEHNYIINEHRGTLREARIHRELVIHALETSERCKCKYVITHVRSKRLTQSRMKLGFKPVALEMVYMKTAEDFRKENPVFDRTKKHFKQISEQEGEQDVAIGREQQTSTRE